MPEVLKVLLVDDWQAVTKHNQASNYFLFLQLHPSDTVLFY